MRVNAYSRSDGKTRQNLKTTLFLLFFLGLGGLATAQDAVNPRWNFLGEAPTFVDVFYSIQECNGESALFLQLWNESPNAQSISFDIIIEHDGIENPDILKIKNYELKLNDFVRGECDSSNRPELKLKVPDNFDPKTSTFTVNFK